MQRQKTKRANDSEANIKKRYLPLTDRVWFPVAQEDFRRMQVLDLNKILRHNGFSANLPFIVAIKESDYASIQRRSEARELKVVDGITEIGKKSHEGYLIPTTHLDQSWEYKLNTSIEQLIAFIMELNTRIALTIRHVNSNPEQLAHTHGPLDALNVGYGNCFMQVSVLVAAFRKNNIPARIVGRPDFFGEINGDKWWVEAYIKGQWIRVDPGIHDTFLELALREAKSQGVPQGKNIEYLISCMIEALKQGISFDAISNPKFAEKVKNKVVAAEIELPT